MNKPTDVNALLVMKSESTCVCYFSHRRDQIPNKKQLKGEQVYFDFWFEETQSVHRDGENGVSGVSQLLTSYPHTGRRNKQEVGQGYKTSRPTLE